MAKNLILTISFGFKLNSNLNDILEDETGISSLTDNDLQISSISSSDVFRVFRGALVRLFMK